MKIAFVPIGSVVTTLVLGLSLRAAGDVAMETVKYEGWENCVRLTNGTIELIVTTDVGPRVIHAGFVGKSNVFRTYEDQLGTHGGDEWRIYGGHRLWHAPEAKPRTYASDNEAVAYEWNGKTLLLRPGVEASTGIRKELEITLDPNANHVTVLHRLANENAWPVTLAPWALSVMAQGGRGVFPQEEYRAHSDYLLPARPIVLWHYTDMSDPRFTWGTKYIQVTQDPKATTSQKFGMFNKQGWAAYVLPDQVFIKVYTPVPNAPHPDYGSNVECYTDASMLELETVGPLTELESYGGSVEHIEHWVLHEAAIGNDENALDNELLPLIADAKALAGL